MRFSRPRLSPSRLSLAIGGSVGALAIGSFPARAQQFYEFGGGWNAVAPAPGSTTDRFRPGPFFRGSIGTVVAPHIRIRLDGDAMFFRFQMEVPLPCPSTGCPNPLYDDRARGVIGVVGSGLISLDPRDIFYLIGGLGVYDANARGNALSVGASAGAGLAVPMGSRYRGVVEATWHGLAPNPRINGPRWLRPVAIGLRF